jgi:hypothetical protein
VADRISGLEHKIDIKETKEELQKKNYKRNMNDMCDSIQTCKSWALKISASQGVGIKINKVIAENFAKLE